MSSDRFRAMTEMSIVNRGAENDRHSLPATSMIADTQASCCCCNFIYHHHHHHYHRRHTGKKDKVLPYSLPSIGPGADPCVQAVSPQVTYEVIPAVDCRYFPPKYQVILLGDRGT